jgi:feruloyl esterase
MIPGTGIVPSLQFAFGVDFYKYFVFNDSTWDYSKYRLKNWRRDTKAAGALLNTTDPEMKAFKARKGKLIIYHGWSDPALNAKETIAYYEQVLKRDAQARDHARLFLVPGMFHCGGGTGPSQADWRGAIANWVEHGKAPDNVIARDRGAKGTRTHPLCAYPERAVYDGKGKIDDAASFSCKARS